MSVHDVCTLYAGGCASQLGYVRSPHPGRLDHPSRLKIGTLAGLLPVFNCSEFVFAMDMLAESRFTFRQGLAQARPYDPALRNDSW